MQASHRCLPLRCVHCWELEGQGDRGRGYHAESTIIMARATLKRAMLAARPRVIILANVGNPRCLHLRVALACAELMHAEERREADKTTAHRPLELATVAHHRLFWPCGQVAWPWHVLVVPCKMANVTKTTSLRMTATAATQ